jgi:NAD(P)-dependent dehydrogenase (short-subunit alcohol dehydrogenase family)
MDQLRFDGRTAVVTGAGGDPSLGRAFALLLGERGANVVVNDIGRDPESRFYSGSASAEAVAQEIRDRGGKAVADTHSVTSEDGAAAIVRTALDAFGGLDILVNNAGICVNAPFEEMSEHDFRRHIEINLLGPAWMCRAAWPHMRERGYGRIVNIGSGSMAGYTWQAPYATSKGGLFSLTRAMAAEFAGSGVKVNHVHPGGFTRMVAAQHMETSGWYQFSKANLAPELAAPAVGFLAHESCPVSGECVECLGGEVHRVYLAKTPGFTDRSLTLETLAARWDEVMAGADPSIIAHDDFDVRAWDMKPYRAEPA